MKKTLLAIASISLLLFAGCQKNGVAPKQDSTASKTTATNKLIKDTIMIISAPVANKRDTIMAGKTSPTPSKSIRDTIMVSIKN